MYLNKESIYIIHNTNNDIYVSYGITNNIKNNNI